MNPHFNKVALITGAARRIGAAIARILHENGYIVVIHYNKSSKEAQELVKHLNELRPYSALSIKADLRQVDEFNTLINNIINQTGRLDVLVNNASTFYKTKIGTTTATAWNDLMDIHIKAPYFLAEAAFPVLAKERGSIINISDIHANRPMRDYPVYCIAKAGLAMLTKTLAHEFGPDVRVNSISPGQTIWPEAENALTNDIKNKVIERTALKRPGHPDEIAKAVLFLVRDANYITGQDIAVDGGRLLMI